ncbi:MAG: hypothetical protein KA155_09765 [Alphaproteobacteria bacterium]|nr:hypothetical protein [Alphaproteobacteria bacterium]
MSAAPAISPTYQSAAQPVAGPEPLSELSKRAVADFDHFVHDYLRARKIEQFQRDNPLKFEILSEVRFAHNERLIHWKEVQVTPEEIAELDPEIRNKILVEAIHLGVLGPYHPEHDEALRLHARERGRQPKPVAVP